MKAYNSYLHIKHKIITTKFCVKRVFSSKTKYTTRNAYYKLPKIMVISVPQEHS